MHLTKIGFVEKRASFIWVTQGTKQKVDQEEFILSDLEQDVGKGLVVELEMPLVVELQQGRRVRVVFLEVHVVELRLGRRVTALFADVDLAKTRKKAMNQSIILQNEIVIQNTSSCYNYKLPNAQTKLS